MGNWDYSWDNIYDKAISLKAIFSPYYYWCNYYYILQNDS